MYLSFYQHFLRKNTFRVSFARRPCAFSVMKSDSAAETFSAALPSGVFQ